jgi:cell division protein FtsW (lipid II flippase)
MKNKIFKIITAASLFPFLAFAQVDSPEKVVDLVNTLAVWLYNILIAASVVMIIIAAFNFLSSGGDQEKVTKARQQIIYAVIAVAVAILATGIIKLVQNFLS